MRKNPWVAAILNLILFGAGTLYVGRRPVVGAVVMLGGTVAQIAEIVISPPVHNADPATWPFLLGGLVVLKIGLAIDGYREAAAAGGINPAATR